MERRQLIAILLSTVIIVVGFSIQNFIIAPRREANREAANREALDESLADGSDTASTDGSSRETPRGGSIAAPPGAIIAVGEEPRGSTPDYVNKTIRVGFSRAGGSISSFELLEHLDGDRPVDMILAGETGQSAFDLQWGDYQSPAVRADFHLLDEGNPHEVTFYRDFARAARPDAPFRVFKRYRFYPDEYMFELEIVIENSENEYIPLDFDGLAYTLRFGPQIGPAFQRLDNRNEYRRYYRYDSRRRTVNLNRRNVVEVDSNAQWSAIAGKYFAVVAIPGAGEPRVTLSDEPLEGLVATSQLYISRPRISSSLQRDAYRFYLGPKIRRVLLRYNEPDRNGLGVSNLSLEAVSDTRVLFGWLENILKWILQRIFSIIPNYGIAIIVLTIIVKVMLFPLTHRSYESTARMQALNPKVNELRAKYSDNPQKMNHELAAFYKREGVNPLGGCLPLLLQFPFFIAMFGLFNNHFDLRGAAFITGWIDDLSRPESIWNFGGFTLPLLGWNDLRLLPIIFVLSQLVTSMLTQTPSASQRQTRMMTFILPIVFFFILYDMPSGLLVYWIVTNVLTAGQQFYNSRIKKRA